MSISQADTDWSIHCAALLQVPQLGPGTVRKALALGYSPQELWAGDGCGVFKPALAQALSDTRQQLDLAAFVAQQQQAHIQLVPVWGDLLQQSSALQRLAQVPNPPLVLYIKGDLQALTQHANTLAIVGSRITSDYGGHAVTALSQQLATYGPCIISGLAAGIDGMAHRAALAHGLGTWAVVGHGLQTVYPTEHRALADDIIAAGGLLISEYPWGTPADTFRFPQRNRIVVGLSQGVLVIEGGEKSGALITAKQGFEANRPVFALPGNIFSKSSTGPNALLQQGAQAITSGADIANALQWLEPETKVSKTLASNHKATAPNLQQQQSQAHPYPQHPILQHVPLAQAISIEALQTNAKLDAQTLNTQLTLLELEGKLRLLPGLHVQLVL